jgi:hypothetical protein
VSQGFYVKPVRNICQPSNLVYNESTGEIAYSISSQKYKSNIINLNSDDSIINTTNIYQVNPRQYTFTQNLTQHVGFIAEEVSAVDINLVTVNNDTQQVEGIEWNAMLTYTISELQKLKKDNDYLKLCIEALRNNTTLPLPP